MKEYGIPGRRFGRGPIVIKQASWFRSPIIRLNQESFFNETPWKRKLADRIRRAIAFPGKTWRRIKYKFVRDPLLDYEPMICNGVGYAQYVGDKNKQL